MSQQIRLTSQQIPTDEPTDPTDEPTDPTDEPTDPTDEPTDPTDEPTDPTDEPTDPTDEPTDPTDEPTDPTDEPTDPTDEPTDPTDEPTDPTDEPTDPTDEPTDPTEPTEPSVATVSVTPDTFESPAVGDQFSIDITIAGSAGVAGYQATVNFDSTALSYVSIAYREDYLEKPADLLNPVNVSENSVHFWALGSAPDGEHTLATITFEVIEAKESAITLSNVLLSDAASGALQVTTTDGMIIAPPTEPTEPPVEPKEQLFEITLTSLTTGPPGGQIFSPPIFATHTSAANLGMVGQPANPALVTLAETGAVSGLLALAGAVGANTAVADGLVHPGQSVTVRLTGNAMNNALTVAAMLVSTNDGFILGSTPLYDEDGMPVSTTLDLIAFDAGSEENTELASDIPGPTAALEENPGATNARAPTEDGVIMPHPGVQGIGDLPKAFLGWTEPVATLTITPVSDEEPPVDPEPPEPPEPTEPSYDIVLERGLNMIAVPLMPEEPYTAASLAEKLGATIVIKLEADTQRLLGYSAAEEGDGFAIEGGKGYIVNTPTGGTVTFTGTAWNNQTVDAPAAPSTTTAKNAWAFVITGHLHDNEPGTSYTIVSKNLRTGVVATKNVTSDDASSSTAWANLDLQSVVEAGDRVEITLLDERGTVVSGPFERTIQTSDIHNAYLSVQLRVGDVRPNETLLGQNFPNPFNPETWIPYQLNRDTLVTIEIFDVSGHLVRTLDLGHKSTGTYMTTSTAAYWDGKNDAGEAVSSGIYFYVLKTENFSATRRMVILK